MYCLCHIDHEIQDYILKYLSLDYDIFLAKESYNFRSCTFIQTLYIPKTLFHFRWLRNRLVIKKKSSFLNLKNLTTKLAMASKLIFNPLFRRSLSSLPPVAQFTKLSDGTPQDFKNAQVHFSAIGS